MTPKSVGALMTRARQLLQTKQLSLRDVGIFDVMVFRCRTFGARFTSVSLRRLATLAGCCNDTVIAAIRRLEQAGILRKIKRRIRVRWALGIASRQATNEYEFLPPTTESTPSTVYREQASSTTVVRRESELERALERLRLDQPVDLPH